MVVLESPVSRLGAVTCRVPQSGGDGADTVAFDSALAVTSDNGVIAAGAGTDSLASLLSPAAQSSVVLPLETLPGNDTLSSLALPLQPRLTWALARTS